MTEHATPAVFDKVPKMSGYICPCGSHLRWAPEETHDATRHLRNCMVFRNDVSARLCPKATGSGATHHLIPRRIGTFRGDPLYEYVCRDCNGVEAAIHAIMEGSSQ